MVKRTTMMLALAGAMLATAPATAQMRGYDSNAFWRGAPEGPPERIAFLQQRIDRGMSDGSLDRREGMHAQRDLNSIRRVAMTMRRRDGGTLNPTDRAYVQDRLDRLSSQIRWRRHNGW